MSRGLGQVQLKILEILARSRVEANREVLHGLLVEEIARRFSPPLVNSAAGRSSIRRALTSMHSADLVQTRYWYPHDRGQPQLWMLTDAGLAEVRRRRSRSALKLEQPSFVVTCQLRPRDETVRLARHSAAAIMPGRPGRFTSIYELRGMEAGLHARPAQWARPRCPASR
jgi:hypothetical protein